MDDKTSRFISCKNVENPRIILHSQPYAALCRSVSEKKERKKDVLFVAIR